MIVDANVLIYAVDRSATFHHQAKSWLEDILNGPSRVGFPWVTLTAFQRTVTHPRASASPLSPRDSWRYVSDAHLAAIAIEHGVGVASFHGDCARFNGLTWVNPPR